MEFDLKWVHMARYELILRLDGALWLTIIFKPLLTPKRAFTIQFESYFWMFVTENVSMIWNVTPRDQMGRKEPLLQTETAPLSQKTIL